MSGGGQQSGTTTTNTIQNSDPWPGQQPYIKQALSGAQNLYENYTPGYYPNSTNAPMNEMQGNALGGIYARGIGGSAVDAGAQNLATDTLSGSFLGADNPYFAQMQQSMANKIIPQVMSQFEQSGRYGSGAAANALASALADKTGELAYRNYGDERARQMQTMALAPTVSGTDFTNLNAALGAGGQLQGQQQNAINADAARYNYYQGLPQQSLNNYANIALGNNLGSQTSASSSTPYYTNPTANALGVGSSLLGMGVGAASLFGGNPLGILPMLSGGASFFGNAPWDL